MGKLFRKPRRKNRDRSSRLFCEPLEDRRVLATFTVTDGGDAGPGTLRQAVLDANALPGADIIEFDGVSTVTLTTAQLDVTDSVSINPEPASLVTVQRDAAAITQFRIFDIDDLTDGLIDVSINKLSIQNGDATTEPHTDTLKSRRGGGIDNTENLTVTSSVLSGNVARRGGAISQRSPDYTNYANQVRGGTLTVTDTTFEGNSAYDDADGTGRGGALSSILTGQITITGGEITGNYGYTTGAAIESSVSVPLTITGTTISDNIGGPASRAVIYNSQFGGTAQPDTTVVLDDVTIENNTVPEGVAVFGAAHISQDGFMTVRNSTIRNNVGNMGVSAFASYNDTNLTVENSTISGNNGGGVSVNYYTGTDFYGGTLMNLSGITVSDNGPGVYGDTVGNGMLIGNPLTGSSITNSTISGNQSQSGVGGGGIEAYINGAPTDNEPVLYIESTTITNNTMLLGTQGGSGLASLGANGFVDVRLNNSIVSGNIDANGVAGDIYDYAGYYSGYMPSVTATFTLIGDNTGSEFAEANPGPDMDGNKIGDPNGVGVINAMLGTLMNNGGTTDTHLPMAGSPAIDAGDPAIIGFDQRGYTRPGGAGTDMGSVESDGMPLDLDFNGDMMYDCLDMDMLDQAIDSGMYDPAFDVNMDIVLDSGDVFAWLNDAGELRFGAGRPFLAGDANLDGNVDGSDFGIWNTNKFSITNDWCRADFDQNGGVDGSDFGIWNGNKFMAADAAPSSGHDVDPAQPFTQARATRRVKPSVMGIDPGVIRAPETPVVQFADTAQTEATEFRKVEIVFAAQAPSAQLNTELAGARKVSFGTDPIQSRVTKAEAHDEVMNLFQTF